MSSKDERTQKQKLEAMANQTASPNEAANARHLLFKKYGKPAAPGGGEYHTHSNSLDETPGCPACKKRRDIINKTTSKPWWQQFADDEREEQARPHPYEPGIEDDGQCLTCGGLKGDARHKGQGIKTQEMRHREKWGE